MPTPILQQMLGQGGTMEFVDAAVSGKNYDFLVVNAAATFTTLTGSGGEDLADCLCNVSQVRVCWNSYFGPQWRQDYGGHSKRG
jgi:hypothetical protein